MKRYQYITCCINAKAQDIDAMVDNGRAVTFQTIRRHCQDLREWVENMGYGRTAGLLIQDDWAVSFYKSTYKGVPCYYIRHSAIEYVWVKIS